MHNIVKSLFLLSILVLCDNSYCLQPELKTENEIKKAAENFCNMEYQGKLMDEERGTLIKYSSQSEDYKKFEVLSKTAIDGEHLYPYEWDMGKDPIFIVDSFKIIKVKKIEEKHAYVFVNYHQLAWRIPSQRAQRIYGSEIPIKDIRDISVKLNLEYCDKRWLVIDPPYPKVSYDAMMKYYNEKISLHRSSPTGKSANKIRSLTLAQKNNLQNLYNNEKAILDFLISLKK